jgi:hypothetical protein
MREKRSLINRIFLRRGSDGSTIDPAEKSDIEAVVSKLPTLVNGRSPVVLIPNQSIVVPGSQLTPNGVLTTVVSYTNSGAAFYLTEWSGTGQCEGRFELHIDGVRQQTLRSSAAERNVGHHFGVGIVIATDAIVDIKVFQDTEVTPKTFEGTLIGFR